MQGCELGIQKLFHMYTWITVGEYEVKNEGQVSPGWRKEL